MSIAARLSTFLDEQGVVYDTLRHLHSSNSVGSANSALIPLHQLAKAVVLEDHQSKRMIAVLPTDNKINLKKLNKRYQATFHLLPEKDVYSLFSDCENGAVPPAGEAYHLNAIFDDSLLKETDVYLEAGDHQTLVHLTQKEFVKFTAKNQHTSFSHRSVY